MDRKKLLNILDEIFAEAELGKIVVDKVHGGMVYHVRFFTNIEGDNRTKNSSCPTIMISNMRCFLTKIEKYLETSVDFYKPAQEYFELDENDFNKFLIVCLIINAGYGDFNNFTSYVENKTKQLRNINCAYNELIATTSEYNLLLKTKKLNPNLEAPLKATFCFEGADGKYELPSILYGKCGDVVTIYAVQNMSKEPQSKLSKKLDRLFRKVNKGTLEEENITHVSPSAVVATTLFIAKMKKLGVTRIEAPCILPLRGQIAINKAHALSNKLQLNKEGRDELISEQERVGVNTTERFSYLFLRYAHHFKSTEFYYDEENEKVVLNLKKENYKDDNLIYELEDLIK